MRMRNLIAFSMLLILSGCFARSKPGSKLTGRQSANVDVQMVGSVTDYKDVPLSSSTLEDYRIKGHCDSGVDFDFSKIAKPGDVKPISSDTCKTRLMSLKFKNGTKEIEFKRHDFTNTEWDVNVGDTIRMKDDVKQITLFVKIEKTLDNPVQPSSSMKFSFTSILQGPDHVSEEQRISIDTIKVDGVDAPLFEVRYTYTALESGELRVKFDMECLQNLTSTVPNSIFTNENKCYGNALSDISYVLVPDQTGVAPSKPSEAQDYFDSRQACSMTASSASVSASHDAPSYIAAENNLRAAQQTLASSPTVEANKQTFGTNETALWLEYNKHKIKMVTTKQSCSPMKVVPSQMVAANISGNSSPTLAPAGTFLKNGGFSTFYIEAPWNDLRKKQRMMLILRAKGTGAHANDYSYSVYSVTISL